MSEIILFLIKGVVVVIVTSFIMDFLRKSTYQKVKGALNYKIEMKIVAVLNLAFAILLWWVFVSKNYQYQKFSQTVSLILLIIFFTASSLYLLAEVLFTKGRFDEEGIYFQSIWGGKREKKWKDLISIDSNDTLSWYILTFKDGEKIRISYFLGGAGDMIDFLIDEEREEG